MGVRRVSEYPHVINLESLNGRNGHHLLPNSNITTAEINEIVNNVAAFSRSFKKKPL